MKNVIGTMLFTTAIVGMLGAQPAHAWFFKSHADNSVTTRSVTETKLTRSDIISIQSSLSAKGYYKGSIDGKWGPMTSSALSSFQSAQGLAVNGLPTNETLAMLGVTPVTTSYAADTAPQNIEPAAGGVTLETTTTSDVYRTRTTGGFVAINTNHENGAACRLCTNGIIGNGGTPSMRSNEY
jgi:peptidoglycan hydrolase-like protein with peptidoglycan-binding domain